MIYFYEIIFLVKSCHFPFLKVIFFLIILMRIFSLIKISKSFFSKNYINGIQINEIKYLNYLLKDKIKKLENELNSMKDLNLEYQNLINKALLTEKKEFKQNLLNQINKVYIKNKIVNINEVESSIKGGRKWKKNENKAYEINLGFQLDPNYILRTMMTLASIIDSQKDETKIRLHFAVVLNFTAENMLKIYSLRERMRNDVEFNFYNAKKVEEDFKGVHPKGPGAIAKILLPHILPDDIHRIIIFDTGDLLVLRDLKEMYNWNMGNYLYLGAPDPCIGKKALISKKPFDVYII